MKKPRMKREVAIVEISQIINCIVLYASREAAQEFAEFGKMVSDDNEKWFLYVDLRFDFHEVLQYIKNY